MSFVTVEVDIREGRILPREPEKVPQSASGLLTIFKDSPDAIKKTRIRLPLIKGDGKRIINPTREQLDAAAWGD
jgi:hypothetical protein